METKALKKQLGAAIAMVVVAAIALGSATYAWFVTNSTVKATTTTISAQSNAAYMTIQKGTTGAKSSDLTQVTTDVETKALYPATHDANETSSATTGEKLAWKTGYGTSLTDGALKTGTNLIYCTDPANQVTAGTTAAAVAGDFALQQDYNISCKSGQTLSNLKVSGVSAATTDSNEASTDASLKTALRIFVASADGSAWAVYGLNNEGTAYEVKSSSATDSADVVFATEISSTTDTVVHVYLYYEGSDVNVTTKNLVDGKLTATNAVTVTFTATENNK